MVWKEIVICDACGKEIKARPNRHEVSIQLWKGIAEKLGLPKEVYHRRRHRRRRTTMVTIDVCSKECFVTILEKIKEAMG